MVTGGTVNRLSPVEVAVAEDAGVTARSLMLIVTRPKDPGATERRTTDFPLVGRTAT
jgi:hypothetical protein